MYGMICTHLYNCICNKLTVAEEKKSAHGFSYSGKENGVKNLLYFAPEAVYMDAESTLPNSTPEADSYVSRTFFKLYKCARLINW